MDATTMPRRAAQRAAPRPPATPAAPPRLARRGRFVAVANMKGGVGKTTTVVGLAESLLAHDPARRVLVVDLDPQASASVAIAGDDNLAAAIGAGLAFQDLLQVRVTDRDLATKVGTFVHRDVSETWHMNRRIDLSLMPCGPQLRLVEKEIVYDFTRGDRSLSAFEGEMSRLFERDFVPLLDDYDFVVFDCPPGISTFAEVAVRRAHMVVVPTIPDAISTYGLSAFVQSVWGRGGPTTASRPHVLVNRMQRTRSHAAIVEAMDAMSREPGCHWRLLRTRVPQLNSLANALGDLSGFVGREPTTYAARYPADVVGHMGSLVDEVLGGCRLA